MEVSLEEKFNKAAENVKKLNTLDDENLLFLYGLYKQITCGNCNVKKPGLFDIKGKAKWAAWESRKGLKKEEGQKLYINKVTILLSQK